MYYVCAKNIRLQPFLFSSFFKCRTNASSYTLTKLTMVFRYFFIEAKRGPKTVTKVRVSGTISGSPVGRGPPEAGPVQHDQFGSEVSAEP
jgi:hypothetical protein